MFNLRGPLIVICFAGVSLERGGAILLGSHFGFWGGGLLKEYFFSRGRNVIVVRSGPRGAWCQWALFEKCGGGNK